ncbi:hypothetical protein ABVT39_000830 [Epinephelus coioides]
MATKEIKKDIEDLKNAVNMMSDELAKKGNQQLTITNLMNEIKKLKKQNEEQTNKIKFLKNRVSDLEQYLRMNDVIITGMMIKPQSYAKALKGVQQQDSDEHDDP